LCGGGIGSCRVGLGDLAVSQVSPAASGQGRFGGGTHYGLRSVDLPHHPRAPITTHEAFFGALIRIDRPIGLLRIPAGIHKQPLQGGGNIYRASRPTEAFLAEQLPSHNPRAMAPRARVASQETLGTAPATITTVAAMLSMHPRTLQRRVAAENIATQHFSMMFAARTHATT
jgi:hypothetical protein